MTQTQATTYAGKRQLEQIAAKTAADSAKNEGRVSAVRAELLIAEEREKAAERRRARKEAAKTKRLEEKTRRREKRADARRARNHRIAAALGRPLPWVLTVVITSVGFAFPGQFSAVVGLGVVWMLAMLVPVFIEGATWAMAWMRKWAVANNKPAKLYTVATWLFALVAAGLNAWHHADKPQLAAVFAASSLFGVAVWEIYMHSQQHAANSRSAADLKLALQRRIRHPRVARRAAWLRTSTIPALTEAAAWDMAWRQLHGAEPGVTRSLLKRHSKRASKIADLLAEREEQRPTASLNLFAAPPTVIREVPAGQSWCIDPKAIAHVLANPALALRADTPILPAKGAGADADGASKTSRGSAARSAKSQVVPNNPPSARGRKKGVTKQSRGARTAASHTARAATPEQAEREKNAARAFIAEQLAAGKSVVWQDVQKAVADAMNGTRRSETWCRERIKETTPDSESERPLHLVAAAR